jgi:cytochrome c553
MIMAVQVRSMFAENFRSSTLGVSLVAACLLAATSAGAGEKQIDFAKEIQPIFVQSCNRCHGGSNPEKRPAGNLRLDDAAAAMKGGKSGPSIIPGKGKDSLLYKVLLGPVTIKGRTIPLMPKTWGGGGPGGGPGGPGGGPKGGGGPGGPGGPGGGQGAKLPAEKIDLIKKWIDQGARWPKDAKAAPEGDGAGDSPEGDSAGSAPDKKDTDTTGSPGTKGGKDAKGTKAGKSGKDVKVDFAKDIQPILAESCVRCHGAPDAKDPRKKSSAGLRLDDLAATMKGSRSGKVILPGKARDSLLYKLLLGPAKAGGRNIDGMPKSRPGEEAKLAPEKIELIRLWIDQGARGPSAK